MISYHKNDLYNRLNICIEDGKRIAMPRYYKNKIYDEKQIKQIAHHFEQTAIERENAKTQAGIDLHGENYWSIKNQYNVSQFKKMYNDAKIGRDKI